MLLRVCVCQQSKFGLNYPLRQRATSHSVGAIVMYCLIQWCCNAHMMAKEWMPNEQWVLSPAKETPLSIRTSCNVSVPVAMIKPYPSNTWIIAIHCSSPCQLPLVHMLEFQYGEESGLQLNFVKTLIRTTRSAVPPPHYHQISADTSTNTATHTQRSSTAPESLASPLATLPLSLSPWSHS